VFAFPLKVTVVEWGSPFLTAESNGANTFFFSA